MKRHNRIRAWERGFWKSDQAENPYTDKILRGDWETGRMDDQSVITGRHYRTYAKIRAGFLSMVKETP